MAVTGLSQTSRPEALKISVIEQTLVPTGSVPLKVVPWPGSNLGMMMTGELFVGWLLTMTMLDRKSVVEGKSVDLGGSRIIRKTMVVGQSLVMTKLGEV